MKLRPAPAQDAVVVWSSPTFPSRRSGEEFDEMIAALRPAPEPTDVGRARREFLEASVLEPNCVESLMSGLAYYAATLGNGGPAKAPAIRRNSIFAANRAREYIDAHSRETLPTSDIAHGAHVNASYLGRAFKRQNGCTITKYVAAVHVQSAKELLRDDRLSITQIAFASGFGSVARFNVVFKQKTGKTPSQYRREAAELPATAAR